jgi:environmental stress-induced protein Ves
MDAVKRDLRQKAMRIESRAQSHTTEPPTPTAFAASRDDATTELLKQQVSELQDQLKYLQGAASTRRTSYGRGRASIFVVFAIAEVRRVIAGPSARTTTPEVTLRRWTPRLLFRRSWT